MVHVGIRHAGEQIGGAGAERGETDAGLSGQPAIDIGHECRALFVTCGDEADAGVMQRIHECQILFAGNAENVFDIFIFKAADEQFGSIHGLFLLIFLLDEMINDIDDAFKTTALRR